MKNIDKSILKSQNIKGKKNQKKKSYLHFITNEGIFFLMFKVQNVTIMIGIIYL